MDATITAHLDTPVIGDLRPLDGVLAWAWTQLAIADGQEVAPITDDYCPAPPLPLARWERHGYWGWRVSSPIAETVHQSAVEIRRRPPHRADGRVQPGPRAPPRPRPTQGT